MLIHVSSNLQVLFGDGQKLLHGDESLFRCHVEIIQDLRRFQKIDPFQIPIGNGLKIF